MDDAKKIADAIERSFENLLAYSDSYARVARACRVSEETLTAIGSLATAKKCADEAEVFEGLAKISKKLHRDMRHKPVSEQGAMSVKALQEEQVLWERLIEQRRAMVKEVVTAYNEAERVRVAMIYDALQDDDDLVN